MHDDWSGFDAPVFDRRESGTSQCVTADCGDCRLEAMADFWIMRRAAELCSDWTAEGGCPYVGLGGPGRPFLGEIYYFAGGSFPAGYCAVHGSGLAGGVGGLAGEE